MYKGIREKYYWVTEYCNVLLNVTIVKIAAGSRRWQTNYYYSPKDRNRPHGKKSQTFGESLLQQFLFCIVIQSVVGYMEHRRQRRKLKRSRPDTAPHSVTSSRFISVIIQLSWKKRNVNWRYCIKGVSPICATLWEKFYNYIVTIIIVG